MCAVSMPKTECTTASLDVLKKCLNGIHVDSVCLEEVNTNLTEVSMEDKDCFCGGLVKFSEMLTSVEALLCGGEDEGRTGKLAAEGDGDCYEDNPPSRLLGELLKDDQISMTPELCQRICFVDNSYKYAGVQYAYQCFCGNVEPPATKLLPRSHCSSPCAGNSDKMCGGSWKMNVYKNQETLEHIKKLNDQIKSLSTKIEEMQESITEMSLHGQWCAFQRRWPLPTTPAPYPPSVISYDSIFFEDSNINNNALNEGTGVFTAPRAGVYLITFNYISHNDPGEYSYVYLHLNGASLGEETLHYTLKSHGGTSHVRSTGGRAVYQRVEAGDTLSLQTTGTVTGDML